MFSPCLKGHIRPLSLCRAGLLLTLAAVGLTACVGDDESPYARRPAFFRFGPVTAAPHTLLPALGNPGEWCTVTIKGSTYDFRSITTGRTDNPPLTALDNYGSPTWCSGLIIGTPILPDMDGAFRPVAYDLVCPNCFEEGGITRAVTVESALPATARCTRCATRYDLDNGGLPIDVDPVTTRRLYRYRCIYDNNTFVVQN